MAGVASCATRLAVKHSRGLLLVLLLAGLASSTACKRTEGSADQVRRTKSGTGPYKIVTTCGMVTDIVRQVAGDRAEVIGLMGEGVDPHLYKPTRGDVKLLLDADVVLYSGLMLEGRMGDVLTQAARGGRSVYPVTERLDHTYLREPPEFQGHYDPHVWMDPKAWSACVALVADVLAEYDPEGADDYHRRAAEYRTQLDRLDQYVRQVIGTIPAEQRYLITAHDAFGYFSRAFEIPVRSIQGISTDSEAGVEDVNRLIDFIVDNHVRAVFVESSVSQRNVNAVIEGAGRRDWKLAVGGQLYSDAMGPAGTYEGTYIGMIDHNATTIARALGGQAPERGMDGKLRQQTAQEAAAHDAAK